MIVATVSPFDVSSGVRARSSGAPSAPPTVIDLTMDDADDISNGAPWTRPSPLPLDFGAADVLPGGALPAEFGGMRALDYLRSGGAMSEDEDDMTDED